jgi:hypothetical protein
MYDECSSTGTGVASCTVVHDRQFMDPKNGDFVWADSADCLGTVTTTHFALLDNTPTISITYPQNRDAVVLPTIITGVANFQPSLSEMKGQVDCFWEYGGGNEWQIDNSLTQCYSTSCSFSFWIGSLGGSIRCYAFHGFRSYRQPFDEIALTTKEPDSIPANSKGSTDTCVDRQI